MTRIIIINYLLRRSNIYGTYGVMIMIMTINMGRDGK